jgi:hypothetical protein
MVMDANDTECEGQITYPGTVCILNDGAFTPLIDDN